MVSPISRPSRRCLGAGLDGVWDGDQIELGAERLEVIGLVAIRRVRSHSATSAAAGRISSPETAFFLVVPADTSPADFASLLNDLETKIFDRFDDNTVVHPGHGDDTTLGAERPHLAEWRKRGCSHQPCVWGCLTRAAPEVS